MSNARITPIVESAVNSKKRAACDECGTKKLKCTGEQPSCARCVREGLQCVYSPQKTMGRPKKRLRANEDDGAVKSVFATGITPSIEHVNTETIEMPPTQLPGFEAQPWLSPTSWPDFDWEELAPKDHALQSLTHQDGRNISAMSVPQGSPSASSLSVPAAQQHTHDHRAGPTSYATTLDHGLHPSTLQAPVVTPHLTDCACLSSLYLALHTLQSPCCEPHLGSFPHALQPLRDAMQTASNVIPCEVCPKRFLSAIQNVHLMGALLLSIAERFGKVLSHLSEEAQRASAAGEVKSFRLLDLSHSGAEVCNSSSAAFHITLRPDEWRILCKKVVRVEVGNSVDGVDSSDISLVSLCRSLRQRQDRWHQMKCPDDFPRDPRPQPTELTTLTTVGHTNRDHAHTEGEHFCVKMVSHAEKLIESFDWS